MFELDNFNQLIQILLMKNVCLRNLNLRVKVFKITGVEIFKLNFYKNFMLFTNLMQYIII